MTEVSQNAPPNTGTEELSIVDKYFSLKKEQRINRMQFFVRNIIGVFLGGAPIAMIGSLIFVGQQFGIIHLVKDGDPLPIEAFLTMGIVMIFSTVIYYILCINNCKRAHDFNHKGLWYNLMFYIGIFVVGAALGFLIFIGTMIINGDAMQGIVLGLMGGYVSIYIAQLITWGILQFRKGNPGNNQYGPAPTGKPLV